MRYRIVLPKFPCSGRPMARRGALLLLSLFAGPVPADPGERLTPFLRQYSPPQERPVRQIPAFAPAEIPRRGDMDERAPRRWSPEERRQLRRDVHEAGRDVYGMPPRRLD